MTAAVDPGSLPLNDDFGFYGSVSLGAGFGFGRFTYSGKELALAPRPLTYESGFNGPFIELSGAWGHQIWGGVGLGLELEANLFPDLSTPPQLPWTGVSSIFIGYVGPVVDWWPGAASKLHLSAGFGLALADFMASQFDIGATDNIVDVSELEGLLGARGHVAAAYELGSGSFHYGPRLDFAVQHAASQHASANMVLPSVTFTLGWR